MSLLWTGVLALGVVAFGWLYWKFPREVFLSAVFFMPFFFVFERWGLHLSTTEIFFSVLILVWLIKSWLERKEFSLDLPVLLPVLLVVGVSFAAVFVAPYRRPALRETIQLVWIFALFYFFVNQLAKGEVAVKEVAVLLVTASALLVFYGFFQYIFCTGPLYFRIAPNRMRAYASFGQPNPYATYLLIVIFLALGLLSNPRGKRPNRIWLALGLLLAGLVTTFSQAGYVGLIGGLPHSSFLRNARGSEQRLSPLYFLPRL